MDRELGYLTQQPAWEPARRALPESTIVRQPWKSPGNSQRIKTLHQFDGEGDTSFNQPSPRYDRSNAAKYFPRRRSKLLNTLSISDPIPNGPEQFDAAAFTTHTLSSPQNLAAVLDHTLLKPDATRT